MKLWENTGIINVRMENETETLKEHVLQVKLKNEDVTRLKWK